MIDWDKLSEQAKAALENAYAPYSHFKVGAALYCVDGSIITGCNVENVSYGLTNCAERTALFRAVAEGKREFSAMAIYAATDKPIMPCGACRQVMAELAPKMQLMLLSDRNEPQFTTVSELLPQGFDESFLEMEEKKGATFSGGNMIFQSEETDMFGHKKLGGIGNMISQQLKELTPQFNHGQVINTITQRLGYLVRCGDPDALDSIVPMAYGNLALDLINKGLHGRLVILRNGRYDNAPIEIVTSSKKIVDVPKFYNTERLRPQYNSFEFMPQMIL